MKADSDKVARAQAVTPLLEAGKVFLPGAAWLADFIDELAAFTYGTYDDAVDSTAMALADLRTLGREPNILTYLKNWHAEQGIEAPKLPPVSAA